MSTINGLQYFEVHFDSHGDLDPSIGNPDGGLRAAVAGGTFTDLFVFAHGWNNGVESARNLYQSMFGLLSDQVGHQRANCAAVGVFWPSLLFPEDDPATATPGPATGEQLVEALAPAFPEQQHDLARLGGLLDEQPQDPDKLSEFHALASTLVTTAPQGEEDTGESPMITDSTAAVIGQGVMMAPKGFGDAQGIGNPFSGLWSGAREVMRTLSYYEMKNRAGVVGRDGLGPLLGMLTGPPRIHLIGHSFGARLVAYALAGLPADFTGPSSAVKSLSLIQGAFSHFAFAAKLPFDSSRSGALADFHDRVDGPLLATFTAADRAVGWWYPTASMLSREDNQSAEHLVYRWGAMGHDGYQQQPTASALPLANAGAPYDFTAGIFYALDANDVIKENQSPFSGAHSDIRHSEVLWAVASAAGLGA